QRRLRKNTVGDRESGMPYEMLTGTAGIWGESELRVEDARYWNIFFRMANLVDCAKEPRSGGARPEWSGTVARALGFNWRTTCDPEGSHQHFKSTRGHAPSCSPSTWSGLDDSDRRSTNSFQKQVFAKVFWQRDSSR